MITSRGLKEKEPDEERAESRRGGRHAVRGVFTGKRAGAAVAMQPSSVGRCVGDPPLQPPDHWVRGWALKAETWFSRVAVVAPACDHARHESPPAAFTAAAVQALRADPEELVVALVASRASTGPIARALRSLPAVRVISYAAGVNASLDARAHFALLAADQIVVAGSPSLNWGRAAQRGARRAPYHAGATTHLTRQPMPCHTLF